MSNNLYMIFIFPSLIVFFCPRSTSSPTRRNHLMYNVATCAMMFQVLIMYYSAHKLKTGREWTELGTSAYLALQLDYFRRSFGDLLLLFPTMLKYSTFAVLHWQYWGIWYAVMMIKCQHMHPPFASPTPLNSPSPIFFLSGFSSCLSSLVP